MPSRFATLLATAFVGVLFASQPASLAVPAPTSAYSTNLTALAAYVASTYNSTEKLLGHAWIGGCGVQPNGFNLIDENFLSGPALQPYNPSLSGTIVTRTQSLLASVGYQHNDRREVLYGRSIPFPPLDTNIVTVQGTPPACPADTGFWIVTALPNPAAPLSYTHAMNIIVPAILEEFKMGKVLKAHTLFGTALSWWTGKGFKTDEAKTDGFFNTRDIAYFLLAQRATRFSVASTTLQQMEKQLWNLQLPEFKGGLATSYQFNGAPMPSGGHTSNEINGLALLAYDPRLQTVWWP